MECFDIIFGIVFFGMAFIAGVIFEKSQNESEVV